MKHHWHQTADSSRQHWLYYGTAIRGLVYTIKPGSYSVYGESFEKNPFARTFLGVFADLDEAKDMLLTITASQNI